MKYIDIHSHIHDKEFDADRNIILHHLRETDTFTITVGTYLESSRRAVELAMKEKGIYSTIGLHPTDTKEKFSKDLYLELAQNKKVVAIGECGLDYFHGGTSAEEKKRQREIFESQIELALSVNKPLMIHGRPTKGSLDAYYDIIEILKSYKNDAGVNLRGNIHFFAGDIEIAKEFLKLGFTMSFTGVITFTNDYDEVIKFLPDNSIMSETDSPYVAPVPHRGKRNEPSYVSLVVKRMAEIRGQDHVELASILVENAKRVFLT